ncbi:MAG: GNAT family N-acetyltransferase [Burkholderiaceae bacterium]
MQALEDAAFAAWPSQESFSLHGWRIRLDRGYTKRANSANATAAARPLSDADIAGIEARFRLGGLTPVFRLTSFAPVREVDAALERRGYLRRDFSLVMARDLSQADDAADPAMAADAAAWLESFRAVSGKDGADQAAHLDILRRIAHPCAWGMQAPGGVALCCGLGVLADGAVGLFDLATRADSRRQGRARELCGRLVSWGRRHGARRAFLQVVQANRDAVALYGTLGFRVAYGYWYRVHPAGSV